MQIQINTDHNVPGREALSAHVSSVVEHALSHVKDRVTRVEVHLPDENGPKSGSRDLRCAMEARLASHQPVAVTEEAETLHQAIDGAAEKLARLIENTLGRLRVEKKHRTDPVLPESEPPASP